MHVPLVNLAGLKPSAVIDQSGRLLPVQICDDEMIFMAEELPSLGIGIYCPVFEIKPTDEGNVKYDPTSFTLENGLIQLQVNPQSGEVERLKDLVNNRMVQGHAGLANSQIAGNETWLNRMQILWEQPHGMSAWNIGEISHTDILPHDAQTRWVETGPVRGVIETKRRLLNSTIIQRIVVYRKLSRIDFETSIDWHERSNAHADAPMLRVTFSPKLENSKATFEIPYAGLERPAEGHEVPALRWIDLSEVGGNYGVSLLNNCKYGHQVNGNVMGLTLLRTPYEPDVNPEEGLHQFTYALYPHSGGWQTAGTIQKAVELNQPLEVMVTHTHAGQLQPGASWITCTSESVLVSACKLAEDQPVEGRATIVRLFESAGKSGLAALKFGFPVKKVEETDLMELRIADFDLNYDTIHLIFSHHEVKTIKITT